jgi:hypothetical protein
VASGAPAPAYQRAFLARTRAQMLWARAVDASFRSAPARTMTVAATALAPSLARLVASLTRVKGLEALLANGAAPPLGPVHADAHAGDGRAAAGD